MLGRKLTLVKENSFTRRAQQSHLDNREGGWGWDNTEMENVVCEDAKNIGGVQPCCFVL